MWEIQGQVLCLQNRLLKTWGNVLTKAWKFVSPRRTGASGIWGPKEKQKGKNEILKTQDGQ